MDRIKKQCFHFMVKILLFSMFLISNDLHAAGSSSSGFVSAIDSDLTIKKILILPFSDNLNGVYSEAILSQIKNLIDQDGQWQWTLSTESPRLLENLENNPSLIKKIKGDHEAALGAQILRGDGGLKLRVSLFLGAEGLLFATEEEKDVQEFENQAITSKFAALFRRIKQRLPFEGMVLSRRGPLVTINMGLKWGIKEGDELNIIQITKLQRHPKFSFVTGVDKEIMGKVKVTKVEDYICFAQVITEREKNFVDANQKVIQIKFVNYPDFAELKDKSIIETLTERKDTQISFGNGGAQEWTPLSKPTLGRVSLLGGLSLFGVSTNLNRAGPIEGSANLVPVIQMDGELWLTKNWILAILLRQQAAKISNPLASSSPGSLNVLMSRTQFHGGYNFKLGERARDPKVQTMFGIYKFRAFVDDSDPVALTTVEYYGYSLALNGSLPVDDEGLWQVGGELLFGLTSGLSESPVDSGGASTATINNFSFFASKKISDNLHFRGVLSIEGYGANFSGSSTRPDPATSMTHRLTQFLFGADWFF